MPLEIHITATLGSRKIQTHLQAVVAAQVARRPCHPGLDGDLPLLEAVRQEREDHPRSTEPSLSLLGCLYPHSHLPNLMQRLAVLWLPVVARQGGWSHETLVLRPTIELPDSESRPCHGASCGSPADPHRAYP